MNKKSNYSFLYRLTSLLLAVTLIFFFALPSSQSVNAAENLPGQEENEIIPGQDDPDQEEGNTGENSDDVTLDQEAPEAGSQEINAGGSDNQLINDETVVTDDQAADDTDSADDVKDITNETEGTDNGDYSGSQEDEVVTPAPQEPDVKNNMIPKSSGSSLKAKAGGIVNGSCNVSLTGNGSSISIVGTIAPAYTKSPYYYSFGKVFADDADHELYDFKKATSVNRTIPLSICETGYHTIFIQVYSNNTIIDLLYKTYVSYNDISSRPTYRGAFEVYTNSFTYYPYNMAFANRDGKLYMEYRAAGSKTWKRTGYMQANLIQLAIQQAYKISGLRANTNYAIRIRYGTYVTYDRVKVTDNLYVGDDKAYFFGGPVLNCGVIKTGKAKAPKIKSIKVKAVKVKRHKIPHYGYYTGVYLYTEKFYTCKIKITVKLKKKPGTKGIYVNGYYLKGNKKKYTKTFTPYPNYFTKRPPKGLKKYTVTVRSYQNRSYGGYSPAKSRRVKIK